ncbi:MAG: hypothetical protein ABL921_13370 [Pirellula sp.]
MRHQQLLGQTLPCPKCKGPISVPTSAPISSTPEPIPHSTTKPVGAGAVETRKRPNQPVVNSAAITKAGDPDWDDLFASENFSVPVDPDAEPIARFRPVEGTPASVENVPQGPPLAPRSAGAPIRKNSRQSQKASKRRQVLVLTAIASTGSLLAIVCFVMFVQWVGSQGDSEKATKNPTLPLANANPKLPTEPNTTADMTIPPPVPNQEDLGSVEPTDPLAPTIVDNNPTVVDPIIANGPTSTNLPPSTPDKPSGIASAPAVASAPISPAPSSIPNLDLELADIFAQDIFKPILNPNQKKDVTFGANPSGDDLDVQNATVDIRSVYHPPSKVVPNWEDRSKLPINSFKMNETSLLRCIDWFSRTTGVGITLDWQSCRAAGIDVSKKLQMNVQRKTVAELIAQVVTENGLEWTLDKQGLPVIRAPRAAIEAQLPRDWNVAGLFPKGFEKEGCDLLLQLWQYDDVCQWIDGRLVWNDQADAIEKANLLASLIELSNLTNVNLSSLFPEGHKPIQMFAPFLWNESLKRLNNKVRKSTIVPELRPISELLMIAAAESNLNLHIDWQNAWNHGLVPDETATVLLPGRTSAQVASRFLTNYSLELIPISESSFFITTGDVRRKMIRVLPMSIPKGMKMDDLKQSLFLLAPVGADDRNAFQFRVLPGSESIVLVRICAPRADQISDPNLIQSFGWASE